MAEIPPQSAGRVPANPTLLEQAVVMLVTVRSREDIVRALVQHPTARLDEAAARQLLDEARDRINRAACVDYDHEVGRSLVRLDQLYQQATNGATADPRTALAIQRERAKLLGLYRSAPPTLPELADQAVEVEAEALAELMHVREHLSALVQPGPDESTDELARRVVSRFVEQQQPQQRRPR